MKLRLKSLISSVVVGMAEALVFQHDGAMVEHNGRQN